MNDETVWALLERLQNRDGSALDELMPEVFRQVRKAYAKKLPRHALSEVDDFLSEIALRMVKDYYRNASCTSGESRFSDPKQFWAYVHSVCRNTATDMYRYANAKMRQGQVDGGSAAARIPVNEKTASSQLKDRELCENAWNELEDDEKLAYESKHFQGLSRAEIAQMMNLTVDEIRYLLYKATRKLEKNGVEQSSYL